jgi:PAS domain S-box-containing protein
MITALLLFALVRQALRREREQEERYRSMFENNHAVMLLIDPDEGAIVDANPAACDFYGYGREQLRALRVSDLNILDPAQIASEMAHARAMRRTFFEFSHRRADGTVREVEVYSGPVPVEGHQLLYSIVHDITGARKGDWNSSG